MAAQVPTKNPHLRQQMKKLVWLSSKEDSGGYYICIYNDSHLRFSARIDLISALISFSVSPS